ncbi:hypothetical protein Tco_0751817 [Tanacetum coccineum]|uniref:Uncharacterized protein n=1 Tax=Tanacetum coccineum TaxID=301880 RepID=A0ABQ4Z7R2_9ASTR
MFYVNKGEGNDKGKGVAVEGSKEGKRRQRGKGEVDRNIHLVISRIPTGRDACVNQPAPRLMLSLPKLSYFAKSIFTLSSRSHSDPLASSPYFSPPHFASLQCTTSLPTDFHSVPPTPPLSFLFSPPLLFDPRSVSHCSDFCTRSLLLVFPTSRFTTLVFLFPELCPNSPTSSSTLHIYQGPPKEWQTKV